MRLVSLACSNTEIVAGLGCVDLLVGVDDHSDFPAPALEGLPRLGPDLQIDLDRVEALRPDLVLASLTVPGHETVVEGLEARGIPHLVLAPLALQDVYHDIREIADHLGVPERGAALAEEMQRELGWTGPEAGERSSGMDPAEPIAPKAGPAVLIQWWPKPVIVPAGRSWVNPLLEASGARNPIGHEPRPSRPLSDAEVVGLDPDAIVVSWCGVHPSKYRPDVVLDNPSFRSVRAVRERKVFCIPEAYLGRPGPRLVEGLRELRKVVRAC